jgi:hypothetical protein
MSIDKKLNELLRDPDFLHYYIHQQINYSLLDMLSYFQERLFDHRYSTFEIIERLNIDIACYREILRNKINDMEE